MSKTTWDDPLGYSKLRQAEAAAIRAEMKRQEATPLGQLRLEKERLQAQFDQQERQRGAEAMAEAKRIHAESPHIPVEVAFNTMVTNRAGDGLTLEEVMRLAETRSPQELEKLFAEKYKDDPSGLVHAHRLAGRALRIKQARSRSPALTAAARKLKSEHPGQDIHWCYSVAADRLGIK